jgi:hypothetical protein
MTRGEVLDPPRGETSQIFVAHTDQHAPAAGTFFISGLTTRVEDIAELDRLLPPVKGLRR